MASAYTQVTRENLESLEALGRDTPPPTSQQAVPDAVVEKLRVRGLMTALQRHDEGCRYLRELDITEDGFDGILCGGVEPTLADLEHLTRMFKAKNKMLRLQDPPAKRLGEAKNSVLNLMRALFYGGPSCHLVLAQDQDMIIDDYGNPKMRFNGSEKECESPTWWESKYVALSIQRDEAQRNPDVLIPPELEEAVSEIGERLAGVRKMYRRLLDEDKDTARWVQSVQRDVFDKRNRESDDEDAVLMSRAKRRRLSGEAAAMTDAKQPPVAMATFSMANKTAARIDVTSSRRSTRKSIGRGQMAAKSRRVRPAATNTLRRSAGGNRGAPTTTPLRRQARKTRTPSQTGARGQRQQDGQKSRVKPAVTRSGVGKSNTGSMSGGQVMTRSGRESRKPLRYPYTELGKTDGSVTKGRFTNSSGIARQVGK